MRKAGLAVLGAAAALVVVVVVASQLRDGSSGGEQTPSGQQGPAPSTLEAPGGQAPLESFDAERSGVPEGAPPAGAPGTTQGFSGATGGTDAANPALALPQVAGRKIVRNASVTLSVEDVGASVQEVERIVATAGGFVSSSSVFVDGPPEPVPQGQDSEPPKRTRTATVEVRVPAEAYATVMGQLRGIAKEVEAETSQTSDVTEEFADMGSRQRNLEATEQRYLELLQRAQSIPDILTLQDRLNGVRLEIEQVQGRINLLNDLTDLATISVQLQPFAAAAAEPSAPGWAEQAWDQAWEASSAALEAMGTAAIVAGVVLAWLAVPGLAIVVAWRLLGLRGQRKGEA